MKKSCAALPLKNFTLFHTLSLRDRNSLTYISPFLLLPFQSSVVLFSRLREESRSPDVFLLASQHPPPFFSPLHCTDGVSPCFAGQHRRSRWSEACIFLGPVYLCVTARAPREKTFATAVHHRRDSSSCWEIHFVLLLVRSNGGRFFSPRL